MDGESKNFASIEQVLEALTIPDNEIQQSVREFIKININNLDLFSHLFVKINQLLQQRKESDFAMTFKALVLLNSWVKNNFDILDKNNVSEILQQVICAALRDSRKIVRRGGLILMNTLSSVNKISSLDIINEIANLIQIKGLDASNFDLIEGYVWLLEDIIENYQNIENADEFLLSKQCEFLNWHILNQVREVNQKNFEPEILNKCLKGLIPLFSLQPVSIRTNMREDFEMVIKLAKFENQETRILILQTIAVVINVRKDVINSCRNLLNEALLHIVKSDSSDEGSKITPRGLALMTILDILLLHDPIQKISSTIYETIQENASLLLPELFRFSVFTQLDLQSIVESEKNSDDGQEDQETDEYDIDEDELKERKVYEFSECGLTLRCICMKVFENLIRIYGEPVESKIKSLTSELLKIPEEEKIEVAATIIGVCFSASSGDTLFEPDIKDIIDRFCNFYSTAQLKEITLSSILWMLTEVAKYIERNNKINEMNFDCLKFSGFLMNELLKTFVDNRIIIRNLCPQLFGNLISLNTETLINCYGPILTQIKNLIPIIDNCNLLALVETLINIERKLNKLGREDDSFCLAKKITERSENGIILAEFAINKYCQLPSNLFNRLKFELIALLTILLRNYENELTGQVMSFIPIVFGLAVKTFEDYYFAINSQKTRLNEILLLKNLKTILVFFSTVFMTFKASCSSIPNITEILRLLIAGFQFCDPAIRGHLWGAIGDILRYCPHMLTQDIACIKENLLRDLHYNPLERDGSDSIIIQCNNCCFACTQALTHFPQGFADIAHVIIDKIVLIFKSGVKLLRLMSFQLSATVLKAGLINKIHFQKELKTILQCVSASLIGYSNREDTEAILSALHDFFGLVTTSFGQGTLCLGVTVKELAFFLEMIVVLLHRHSLFSCEIAQQFTLFLRNMNARSPEIIDESFKNLSNNTRNYLLILLQ